MMASKPDAQAKVVQRGEATPRFWCGAVHLQIDGSRVSRQRRNLGVLKQSTLSSTAVGVSIGSGPMCSTPRVAHEIPPNANSDRWRGDQTTARFHNGPLDICQRPRRTHPLPRNGRFARERQSGSIGVSLPEVRSMTQEMDTLGVPHLPKFGCRALLVVVQAKDSEDSHPSLTELYHYYLALRRLQTERHRQQSGRPRLPQTLPDPDQHH